MRKIQIIVGSPRIKGNTSYLAQQLTNGLSEKLLSETNFLGKLKINPCIDCRNCKKGDFTCSVNDDMQDIYKKMEESDVLIFGTPIYWFGPSAQMKLLIDRLRPYYGNKRLNGKRAALILPAGNGEGDCDLTIEMFKRTFAALGIKYLGAVTSKAYDMGDAAKDKQSMELVKQLVNQINSLTN